ncbi:hypothetical protein Flexsi_1457 [Flexistipes sinusarabici DSM 4947]|uniref:Type II secretion system protein GspN n=1 Tax=Flexistipes sinusarabici (strain ATCC 49648 / DSM 4947 / MAS 10) TaxID=717231 RepID=F8E8B0_FLESM|nr:type II secretion system protein GspN [Flexistipes sinusarabici]AEI15107.1 hypothetical protein Flexsi_1457 [Flexistipes sinusarabici DSM 4947]
MKKTILISIITFIFSFFIFTLFLFPYDTVVKYFINNAINQNRIPVDYSQIQSSPFGTTIKNIEYFYKNKLSLGTLKIDYSPLSIITKSVSAHTADSPLDVTAVYNGKTFDIKVNQTVSEIAQLVPQVEEYVKKGEIRAEGRINPAKMQGKADIVLSNLSVATPVFPSLNFQKITAGLTLNKNRLKIEKVQSSGENKISLNGIVYLNYNSLYNSNVNLNGNIDIAGMKRDFKVSGRLISPRINF